MIQTSQEASSTASEQVSLTHLDITATCQQEAIKHVILGTVCLLCCSHNLSLQAHHRL